MRKKKKDASEEDYDKLRAEVTRLRKELRQEKMRSEALNTMIDVAEEMFNIPVRKKAGTKQRDACTHSTLTLDTPVDITGEDDIIIAYHAALPGGTSPIILDEGPLVTGGAIVKFAGMSTWMNLGTINSTYNNYNIAISAVASEVAGTQSPAAPQGFICSASTAVPMH